MLSAYYCIQPCPAALCTLARRAGSLARAFPAALRALAWQPCARCCTDKSEQVQQNLRALLSRQVQTGSAEYYNILHHAFMSGLATSNLQLLSNLQLSIFRPISTGFDQFHHARQPCPAALLGSLARQFDQFRTGFVFSPISPCFHYLRFHYLHARAAVQQTGSNLFSCSYVDLLQFSK
jgi:hypothetical protein